MDNAFSNARAFVYRSARAVDLARWKCKFENADPRIVADALLFYQNEDGGFANGLDPNILNTSSTPYQTYFAIEILGECSFYDKSHPIIQKTLSYLENCKDFKGKVYALTTPSNNDFPCAHWHNFRVDDLRNTDYCPTASLAGFIVCYADKNSSLYKLGRRLVREAYTRLVSAPLQSPELVKCYISLFNMIVKANETDIVDISAFASKLKELVVSMTEKDPALWEQKHAIRPSYFIDSRKSMFYAEMRSAAEYECDYIIASQKPDGSFEKPHVWLSYPDEWAICNYIRKTDSTIKSIAYLKNFSCLKTE